MSYLNLKRPTRMRVKAWQGPIVGHNILGEGIDVTTMPDSHLACPGCQKPFFEVSVYSDLHRIEVGCASCGAWSTRLHLPMHIDLSKRFGEGRFQCFVHKNAHFVVIKNTDKLCIGCQHCKTQVIVDLTPKGTKIFDG